MDNASEIDAVTSATKNKTRAGKLAAGSYHVNADGADITGVSFPVKVLTPWALENAKQVTDADSYDITVTLKGKESTTTYTGADALFENESYAYYKLSETPCLLYHRMVQPAERQGGIRQSQRHRDHRRGGHREAENQWSPHRLRDEALRF
mgnify:FL=1